LSGLTARNWGQNSVIKIETGQNAKIVRVGGEADLKIPIAEEKLLDQQPVLPEIYSTYAELTEISC
jgi:hypothetical protein